MSIPVDMLDRIVRQLGQEVESFRQAVEDDFQQQRRQNGALLQRIDDLENQLLLVEGKQVRR